MKRAYNLFFNTSCMLCYVMPVDISKLSMLYAVALLSVCCIVSVGVGVGSDVSRGGSWGFWSYNLLCAYLITLTKTF